MRTEHKKAAPEDAATKYKDLHNQHSADDARLVAQIDPEVWDAAQSLALDRLVLAREQGGEHA